MRASNNENLKIRGSALLGMLLAMVVMGTLGGLIIPYDRTFWMTLGLILPVAHIAGLTKPRDARVKRFDKHSNVYTPHSKNDINDSNESWHFHSTGYFFIT